MNIHDLQLHFSIRKLSVGVVSCLIGICFISSNQTVQADSMPIASNNKSVIISNSSSSSNSNPTETKSSNKQDIVDSNNTSPAQIDSHSNQNSRSNSNPTETIASKSNNKQNIVDSNNTSPTQINSHSNQNSTKMVLVNSKLNISSQQPAAADSASQQSAADSAKNKLKMATLKTTTDEKLNTKMLAESKATTMQATDTNGGFDSSWGKLDVNDWKGSVKDNYYQLTDYTGDANHVIVPNEVDFAKAGISTSGKQVGVTSALMHTIFKYKATAKDATVAFSKTNNKKVKAIDSDWSDTWRHLDSRAKLSKFDGTNLDVSNVTNMSSMFYGNQISDLSPLTSWNVSNVTDMRSMFASNQISDLSPLSNWKVGNVTNMRFMFYNNHISDLKPLTNWNVSNVTDMSSMFDLNHISDLKPLTNWNVGNVTNMSSMFYRNHISDLKPLTNWNVGDVTNMSYMFYSNQISDLSPLANWKVDSVTNMSGMFYNNQISDLSPLAIWKVSSVTNMSYMFYSNQISDLSPLANWKWNVSNVTDISCMFDSNTSTQTKTTPVNRVINFVYPAGYTGKKQDTITQTVDVPTQKVKVDLTTKESKPSSNYILDWATKTETTETPDPVYFPDYNVPEIKGLLEPDKTVISKQQANANKPINVTVTYKLVVSNTNDAFALDSKNGLHEHANVNDNGGYDVNYWGKINVDDWDYTTNGNVITITSYKGNNSSSLIIPNGADFDFINGQNNGNSRVEISSDVIHNLAKNATRIGLSKTANNKVVASDSNWADAFGGLTNEPGTDSNAYGGIKYGSPNLTQMDLHNLDTTNITNMNAMFNGGSNLTTIGDVSQWDTSKVTDMQAMFKNDVKLVNIGNLDNWNTSQVQDMSHMFHNATSLTNIGNLSKWDTSKVTNMIWMFGTNYDKQSHLTNIGDLSKWDTSKVTDMSFMFINTKALRHLNISNWNLTNLANKFAMHYIFANDINLTVIANDLKLPAWYQNEINEADYFWNNHMAVITNVPELIRATGDINNLKIDKQDASRSIFYDSKGSSDAIQVLKDANQAYINKYEQDHPKYLLALDASVDQTDPIALANAKFKTSHKLIDFVQTDHATRTIIVHLPNGTMQTIVQTIGLKRNAQEDLVTEIISSTAPWGLDEANSSYTINGVKQAQTAYKQNSNIITFSSIKLPKVPGYKAKVIRNNGLLMVNYLVFAPEKLEANNNLSELQFSNKLATNSTVKSNIIVKSDMYQVVNDDHNWQLPVIKSYDLKFATNKNQIIFAYTKDKQYNYRFVLTFKDGQYRLATFDKQNKLLKTYSIKSYNELAKIIYSLVLINIA